SDGCYQRLAPRATGITATASVLEIIGIRVKAYHAERYALGKSIREPLLATIGFTSILFFPYSLSTCTSCWLMTRDGHSLRRHPRAYHAARGRGVPLDIRPYLATNDNVMLGLDHFITVRCRGPCCPALMSSRVGSPSSCSGCI
ncbi:hypothetical protein BR93DRAFT_994953, partial [Coniochaeta sp. PMI_546]